MYKIYTGCCLGILPHVLVLGISDTLRFFYHLSYPARSIRSRRFSSGHDPPTNVMVSSEVGYIQSEQDTNK
jgi:hypothetical protein